MRNKAGSVVVHIPQARMLTECVNKIFIRTLKKGDVAKLLHSVRNHPKPGNAASTFRDCFIASPKKPQENKSALPGVIREAVNFRCRSIKRRIADARGTAAVV